MKSVRVIFSLFLFVFLSSATVFSQNLTGVKIHINPGHGGWDSDDRGIPTPLFPNVGPNVGFWESQSNLDKGFMLRDMLLELGADVQMSRVQNRTEDDLNLTVIVRMANEFQSDFMISIHSNAGAGTANYVLMLFAGISPSDTQRVYPTPTPRSDESMAISTLIAQNLIVNTMTNWSTPNYNVSGDKTFGRLQMGWSDGYGVMRGLTVPGVISEGAMHDYIPETYRLMNMEYKWLEAWNFKKAFCTYFAKTEIPTGNIAGWVKDSRNLIQDGTYFKRGKDVLLPLNGATISIVGTDKKYTVDNMRNGVYVFKDLAPGKYTVKAEADGYHAQEQEVTVVKNEITYFNFELNKARNTPPVVLSYSPNVALTDSVECSTEIVLNFNWDMDEASVREAFSITPSVAGNITFEDSQYRMRFKPTQAMEISTIYTVKLAKSAKHPNDITMTDDFTFQFRTKSRNRLQFLGGYPKTGDKEVYASQPVFYFVFDKTVNTQTIKDAVRVVDKNGAEIEKASRSFAYNKVDAPYGSFRFEVTSSLTPGENYKVILSADVADQVGIKLAEPVEVNFRASKVTVTDQPIVSGFDNTNEWTYEQVQSLAVNSASAARNTTTKLFGTASYRLRGTFTDSDAYVTYKLNTPIDNISNNKVIGLHIYGDMSGNEIQLQLTAGEDIRYLKLCNLDFVGWEFAKVMFNATDETKYQLTGIRVVHKEALLSNSLDIYLDNMLLYDELLNWLPPTIADNIQVYPNPAIDKVFVETASNKTPLLRLYSIGGKLLKELRANEMNVEDVDAGTYILKVETENGMIGRVLIISKGN